MDQFEQLSPNEKAHAPVFELLDRIAKSPPPRKLTAVVAFRREFSPDWLDFEQARGFRAEPIPINLLANTTAEDAFVTLASEAGLAVENALVSNFIRSVQRPEGVSPVDLAIGILSLANFAQRGGNQQIGNREYQLAGGAEGLLRLFVEQKLEEEVPAAMRGPVLKGIVLSLVDLSKDQRIAEGATTSTIATRADTPEVALLPSLERLAHPRVRLLEKPDLGRYRLPHERLVPVLRQLAGTVLASLDRLKLVFEDGLVRWSKTGNWRNLLKGKELRSVLRSRSYFLQGENVAQRTSYIAACISRRKLRRGISSVLALLTVLIGFLAIRLWDESIDRQKLISWDIPPELLKDQKLLDTMDLSHRPVNDLLWLGRDERLKQFRLAFSGYSLAGIEGLTGLSSLALDLSESSVQNLAGLEKLTGLNSLTLNLSGSRVRNLAGLEKLTGLTSLTLDLRSSSLQNLHLAALEKLTGLTSLTLDLTGSSVHSLAGVEKLMGLTSLTLDLTGSSVQNLAGLENLMGLTSLTLNLEFSRVQKLTGLEKLIGLTSLTLNSEFSQEQNLAELEKLTSLTLNLTGSSAHNLAGLEKLTKLKKIVLDVSGSIALDELGGMRDKQQLTKLTVHVLRGDRLHFPADCKFVTVIFE